MLRLLDGLFGALETLTTYLRYYGWYAYSWSFCKKIAENL